MPVRIKLDYKPKRVDYHALRKGKTAELMNFFHFDGSEMTLRHLVVTGVSLASPVCPTSTDTIALDFWFYSSIRARSRHLDSRRQSQSACRCHFWYCTSQKRCQRRFWSRESRTVTDSTISKGWSPGSRHSEGRDSIRSIDYPRSSQRRRSISHWNSSHS